MTVWRHSQFVKFFKTDPRKAFEYREECLWTEIPVEYLTDKEKKSVKTAKTPSKAPISNDKPKEDVTPVTEETNTPDEVVSEENPDIVSVDDLSIEDMRKILDSNDISYSHLAKENGLRKKLEENNLI